MPPRRSGHRYRQLARQVRATETHCYRCGQPIDWSIPYRDPHTGEVRMDAGTVEHINAVSKRPDLIYDRANAAASHRGCNIKASDADIVPNALGQPSQRW